MQLSEVKQVKQVVGEDAANSALADGWVLLSVVTYNPAISSSGASGSASVTYVLGKSGGAASKRTTPKLTAADIARANDLS